MSIICRYSSPLGQITLTSDGKALTGLFFDDQKHRPMLPDNTVPDDESPVFEDAVRWLQLYFDGNVPTFMPRLRLNGTPFQLRVWRSLGTIAYGTVVTYGSIAQQVARQIGCAYMSAQAVGGAVGRNPVALILPCHRVIGTNGSLTGYAGGLERKAWLLTHEAVSSAL